MELDILLLRKSLCKKVWCTRMEDGSMGGVTQGNQDSTKRQGAASPQLMNLFPPTDPSSGGARKGCFTLSLQGVEYE